MFKEEFSNPLIAIMIHHILSSERSIVLNLLTVLKLIIATSAAIMLQPSTGTALPVNAPRLLIFNTYEKKVKPRKFHAHDININKNR